MTDQTFILLGGAGLVGMQIARESARKMQPRKIIIASLYQREVREALTALKKEFPQVEWVGVWGDGFMRADFTHRRRKEILDSPEGRSALYDDLFGDLDVAYHRARMVQLILEHRPDVIVDSINTATAISYQDVYAASVIARREMDALFAQIENLTHSVKSLAATREDTQRPTSQEIALRGNRDVERDLLRHAKGLLPSPSPSLVPAMNSNGPVAEAWTREQAEHVLEQVQTRVAELARLRKPAQRAFETLLITQSVPQLIRHVVLILRAMEEAGTRLYLKIGTTGTGGMGLNIPYTHGEDKPSAKLMSKTAVAFAHTGLMFLMARTPGAPIVKEIKPAAMVGYQEISMRTITERGEQLYRYAPKTERLRARLTLRDDPKAYEARGKLEMVIVDTGENGLFAKGEFETITAMNQMEFITPEEIASKVVLEIQGFNTGADVLSAIDGAVLDPTYRAGTLRRAALEDLERLENETGVPSVALGQLGPPEISKLLFEAFLLRRRYHTLERVLNQRAKKIADALYRYLQKNEDLRELITSVGVPILAPDGATIWRGPFIRIPERAGTNQVELSPENINRWARKGWVDLRPENFSRWRERFEKMKRAQEGLRGRGSSAVTMEAYLSEEIRIGDVVAWVFNNEEHGYRIK